MKTCDFRVYWNQTSAFERRTFWFDDSEPSIAMPSGQDAGLMALASQARNTYAKSEATGNPIDGTSVCLVPDIVRETITVHQIRNLIKTRVEEDTAWTGGSVAVLVFIQTSVDNRLRRCLRGHVNRITTPRVG